MLLFDIPTKVLRSCFIRGTVLSLSASMIRLPPSSISLSEHDLSFHLQQIDIYHGLLRQGFKKKDILRYFDEHRTANRAATTDSEQSESVIQPAPSCVELAVRGSTSVHSSDPHPEPPRKSTTPVSQSEDNHYGTKLENTTCNLDDGEDLSSHADAPAQLVHRHAPRQSSLLRFAKAISPESSTHSDRTDDATRIVVAPARTYRPRTETYSYNQSEASETDLTIGIQDLHLDPASADVFLPAARRTERSTSPMRPEAECFIPAQVQQPAFPASRPSLDQLNTTYETQAQVQQTISPSGSTYIPLSVLSPRKSSLGATSINRNRGDSPSPAVDFPSSPPGPELHRPQRLILSPSLPPMPTTPTPVRRTQQATWTEPRSQGFDGSFAVYDDSIPASVQPQTPADLVRHSIITEHEAAYTAPVGRIHTPSRSERMSRVDQLEPGEQSPTARAMGVRERRARELLRGVRAEGIRLERLRRQDRERFNRGVEGNNERERAERARAVDGPGPAVFTEPWVDELEGDRVGDENWEAELEGLGVWRPRAGIRVASGNANAGRGWWEERGV